MGIMTKTFGQDSPIQSKNLLSQKNSRSSYPTNQYEINELTHKKQHRSAGSINTTITSARSSIGLVTTFPLHRPRSANWRQGSIVDPKQMALIEFSLPIHSNNSYRRRSVAICNSISEPKENPLIIRDSTLPCLLSFSLTYLKNCQLKVQLHSIQSLPVNLHLQQLTIKIKLSPDGKEKSVHIKSSIQHDTIFEGDHSVLFSNISFEKLSERILTMSIYGKDQAKKTIHLGHVGKIHFNQVSKLQVDNQVNFMHEVEKTKHSSVEVLVSLAKTDDQLMRVDLQRIKGLKIDQKRLDAKFYLQILLLDRHRPLSVKQTKFFGLNSSNLTLDEHFDFNVLSYNSNNFDRLMLMINLYSNSNSINAYKCVARVKLASSLFCSGNGIVHWQQFQARGSFSMWHTLNKEQH
ncbi:unnamed protein product [Adineta ricciae]|uniref:Uncharacterized protein n=1 Tax=Adineta ricciae TaxID=249248 RepID=A0A814PLY0_ADIRI|nr:unnamed protein product [Adineta ricciae]CAF1191974.1 unnamed protein product [Adineta ricciae]